MLVENTTDKETKNLKSKRVALRITNRTSENISKLISMNVAKNMTDAIEIAVEHMTTEEQTKRGVLEKLEKLKNMDSEQLGSIKTVIK